MISTANITVLIPGDAGHDGGQVRRARLMPIDLSLERAANLQWRSVGMKPARLTDAVAQAVNHLFEGDRRCARVRIYRKVDDRRHASRQG